jgi:uncharacterized protein YbjT (DUF2867 family)
MKRVLLAGGSGLVGRQLVDLLAAETACELSLIVRSPLVGAPANVRQHVGPTERWPEVIADLGQIDVAISCLGTTMRTAGSRAAFRAIDHDLIIAFARAARKAGARQMLAISSVGASQSGNFYLRTKAETEAGLNALGFDRLDIMRPGLLTGGERREARPTEQIAIMLAPLTDLLLHGALARYRSTDSRTLALAMARLVQQGGTGRFIHENSAIDTLAR